MTDPATRTVAEHQPRITGAMFDAAWNAAWHELNLWRQIVQAVDTGQIDVHDARLLHHIGSWRIVTTPTAAETRQMIDAWRKIIAANDHPPEETP